MEPNVPIVPQPESAINNAPVLSQIPGQLEGPVSLFSSSWKFFKANWKILVPIVIAPSAAIYLGQIFVIGKNPILLLVAFVLIIAGIIFSIAMQPAAINTIQRLFADPGAKIDFKEQYRFGFKYFWSIILLVIITIPVFFGSAVLFFIPAIIVGGFTSMYVFALIIDDKKGFAALTESYSLVKGRWLEVFGRLLFLIIPAIVVGFVVSFIFGLLAGMVGAASTVGLIVTMVSNLIMSGILTPIFLVYMYKLYNSLKVSRLQNVSTAGFKKWLVAFLVIGIVAMIMIPILAGALFITTMNNAFRNRDESAQTLNQAISEYNKALEESKVSQ